MLRFNKAFLYIIDLHHHVPLVPFTNRLMEPNFKSPFNKNPKNLSDNFKGAKWYINVETVNEFSK